jgi:hypothetical protein
VRPSIRLPAQRDRERTLHVKGYATLEESRLRLDRPTRKRQALEDEQRTVFARLEGQLADERRDHMLIRIVEQKRRRLAEFSDRERREMVRAVLDQVMVGVDQAIEIHGYLPIPGHGDNPVYGQTAWEPSAPSGEPLSIASTTWVTSLTQSVN